jgi:transglutaminase-like putative cysteine protease
MSLKTALLWIALALAASVASAAPEDVIHGSDHFQFTYQLTIPPLTGPGRMWVPLAKSGPFQTVSAATVSSPIPYTQISDRDFHNAILVFTPGPGDAGKQISIKYDVSRKEQAAYPASAADAARFLEPDRLVPINNTFRGLAGDALKRSPPDDLARGRVLYDHVLARMKYDKSGVGWGHGDAQYACDARAGNCTDFHSYFMALARSAGIPARFEIGFTIPAGTDSGRIAGYHCWAEFLADGKWVPVDISEASRNPALADYYFGHHPANRFELSAGRDLVVDPAPAGGPINFLVYPLLESAGQPVPVTTEFTFQRVRD